MKMEIFVGFSPLRIPERDGTTLNFRIDHFGDRIRIQETKLHQNHTLVEKIIFLPEMVYTLPVFETPLFQTSFFLCVKLERFEVVSVDISTAGISKC